MENELFNSTSSLRKDSKHLQEEFLRLKKIIDSCNQSAARLDSRLSPLYKKLHQQNNIFTSTLQSFGQQMAYNGSGVRMPGNYGGAIGKILANSMMGMRASGGNVSAGTSYVVGERGPELFTPMASGNITSNQQLTSTTRPINLVMNITTSDSNSFRRSQDQILSEAVLALRRANRNL